MNHPLSCKELIAEDWRVIKEHDDEEIAIPCRYVILTRKFPFFRSKTCLAWFSIVRARACNSLKKYLELQFLFLIFCSIYNFICVKYFAIYSHSKLFFRQCLKILDKPIFNFIAPTSCRAQRFFRTISFWVKRNDCQQ